MSEATELEVVDASQAAVERVWRQFWLPAISDPPTEETIEGAYREDRMRRGVSAERVDLDLAEGLHRIWYEEATALDPAFLRRVNLQLLKGELFDAYHLIHTAPKVYRYVTGGVTDDPCASFEGIKAAVDRNREELIRAFEEKYAEARARGDG